MASKEMITKIILKAQADNSITKAFSALTKNSDTCIGKLSKMGTTAVKTFAGIGVAAATTGTAAVVGLSKAALESYAEYEQLVGGVETLFKDSSGKLIEYANNAYKTAGLSSNEYMSTITSFSAAMINSLGGDTAKATEYSNQAVIDMSDNANKMGTAMESIMNTYQSLSRGQYGMLDNLKLGYGGTKAEMERLLADAQKLTGIKYDISNFGDVTQAIHAIQEKMGITGTTAKEASTTIQGSWSALKSSWANLMTGLADPAQDLDDLIQKVFDSGMTFLDDNLLPRIKKILPRISKGITKFAPKISQAVKMLITPLIPIVVDGASSIMKAVVSSLPTIFSSLMGALPKEVQKTLTVLAGAFAAFKISSFINTVAGATKELKILAETTGLTAKLTAVKTQGLGKTVSGVGTKIASALGSLGPWGWAILAIIVVVTTAFTLLWKKSESFRTKMTEIWNGLKAKFASFGDGIVERINLLGFNFSSFKEMMGTAFKWIGNVLGKFFHKEFVTAFEHISRMIGYLLNIITGFVDIIVGIFTGDWKRVWTGVKTIVVNVFNSLKDAFLQPLRHLRNLITLIGPLLVTFGKFLWNKAKEIGRNFVNGIISFFNKLPQRIGFVIGFVIGKIILFGQKLWNFATTKIPQFVESVINWFAKLPGRIWNWLLNTIQKVKTWGANLKATGKESAQGLLTSIVNKIKEIPGKMLSLGKDIVTGLWNGIKNAKSWLTDKIKSFANGITDGIKAALKIKSPSRVMEKLAKFIPMGVGNGIVDNAKYAVNAIKNLGGKITNTASKISPTISTKVAEIKSKLPKHGKGGSFSKPHPAIVGDKPETIVPHGNTPRNRGLLGEAIHGVFGKQSGGKGSKVFNITFAPTINGGNAEENKAMLQEEYEKFKQFMKEYLNEEGELAF